MKKILFVTSSSLEPKNYSGDTIRSLNIIKYLSKKNIVDVVCSSSNKNSTQVKKNGKIYFFKTNNILLKLFYTFLALLKFKPLQVGYFFSKKIKKFLDNKYEDYDSIIFHMVRSAQYLPKNYKGKKILEMTDLGSNNYNQIKKYLSFFNLFYYLYFLESFLIKKYEKICAKLFDKTVIVSRKDLNNSDLQFNKKIIEITNGTKNEKKTFSFHKKNFKILFIGNINYLPNKYACYDFSKNILPKINSIYPEIEFHIIGTINRFDKLRLCFFKNVKVLGKINFLDKNIKLSVCGIANLRITTGVQNKVFTYMSYALPAIASAKSASGTKKLLNNKDLLIYKNKKQFINKIIQLKTNKILANKLSKNSYSKIKKLSWENTLKDYNKII